MSAAACQAANEEGNESLVWDNQSKPIDIWKWIKSLRNKQSNNLSGTVSSESDILTDRQNIAEQLNSLFVNAGRTSTSNCQDGDKVLMRASSSLNIKLRHFVSKTSKASESFQVPLASVEFLYTQFKSLKNNHAKGIDDIGPYCVKMTADIILPSLCYVLNTNIITGIFPSSWKLAKVTPLYKKGKGDNIENYHQYLFTWHFAASGEIPLNNFWRAPYRHYRNY